MKDKFIIILIIIICITLVFINKINTKTPIVYPTIYIIGLKRDYIYFEDYVKSVISKLSKHNIPYDLHLDNVISDSFFLNKTMNSHFIFLHDLEYVKISEETEKKIIPHSSIINTEQLTRRSELTKMVSYINKGYKIIDYSIGNIKILNTYNFPKNTIFYLPYQVNTEEIQEKNNSRPFDMCSITPESSTHRKYVYYTIKSFELTTITPVYGFLLERDNEILKHKMLLNIHFNPSYSTYESIRCDRLIFNKVIIFSEKSLEGSIPEDIRPYVIEFESLNDAYTKLEMIMKNSKAFYDNFWSEFSLTKLNFHRELYFNLWLESIL
jgi:hypothetical protein